jgi:hypothetical protein
MLDEPVVDEGKLVTIIELEEGEPSVMQVEREGRVYLYGRYVHRDLDTGKLQGNYWMGKIDKSKSKILKGACWELIDQYRKWRADVEAYEDRRRQARYSFENEAYKWVSLQMNEWDRENPKPLNPLKN